MVVFDSSLLLYLIEPDAAPPIDSHTGQPVEGCRQRLDYYIEGLSEERMRILIPTPALSEVLVGAGGNVSEYLNVLTSEYSFKIADFDTRAAIEVAMLTEQPKHSSKAEISDQTKAKIKYDRQIVAIAKVNNAEKLLVDDQNCQKLARANDLNAEGIADLPLPPEPPQTELVFPEHDEK